VDLRRPDREDLNKADPAGSAFAHDLIGALFRRAARQRNVVRATMLSGFAVGVAYRLAFNAPHERDFGNFLRSGLHGVGIALTVWTVLTALDVSARTPLGGALRRLPLAAEAVIRALIMTSALVIVGLTLQIILYLDRYRFRWLTEDWLATTLPGIVLLGFGFSLVIGLAVEVRRLIGDELLASVILGTYHRPARKRLIVMFLDLAHSTSLAEALGELRVQDLITRFFFDIDEPIADFGGAVHAYVGDEVIVAWPATGNAVGNARPVACFFAIARKMAALKPAYEREFGVAPSFRAGVHAGPVAVSECGDAKRQLAYFGDTMNVAARLCEHCKAIDRRLVISGDLLRLIAPPQGVAIGAGESVTVRGRRERVEAHVVEPAANSSSS
jgi:class 3 adenylate cyclase